MASVDAEVGTSASDPEPEVDLFGTWVPYKYIVAIVFVSAMFLDILDTTIVNVALEEIGKELVTDSIEWIVLGYTLSLAVWIPASGWLGDRFGTKRVFLTALVLFIGGSALCGAAQTIEQLIAFRVVQGVGGGMLTPVGIAMLFRAFPPAERARAATLVMLPTLVAPALGPVLGGVITDTIGWRWIFLVNVPIGVVALAFGLRFIREHTEPTAGGFDVAGFVLSGFGLAAVAYALNEGPRLGWTTPVVTLLGIGGIVSFALLVYVETHRPDPMLALRLLRDRMFRTANLVMFFAMASFIGLTFVLPLYLQSLRGFSATQSGLTTFPQAIGMLISSQVAGRVYARFGPRRMVIVGMVGSALAMAPLLMLDLDTTPWLIRVSIFARGMAMGITFVPIQAASYAKIAAQDNGRASAIFSTQRQMAISVGIALMATILSTFMPLGQPPDDRARALVGYHWAVALSVGLAVVAAVLATRINDDDAADTRVDRVGRVGRVGRVAKPVVVLE